MSLEFEVSVRLRETILEARDDIVSAIASLQDELRLAIICGLAKPDNPPHQVARWCDDVAAIIGARRQAKRSNIN
jgi:hypothetical protein